MTAPICPVCGREMRLVGNYSWQCDEDQRNHLYAGPDRDKEGILIRAQIAAMEKRIIKAHRFEAGPGASVSPRELLGLYTDSHPHTHSGATERFTTTPMPDHVKRLAGLPLDAQPAGAVVPSDWWRTGKCGECAYWRTSTSMGNYSRKCDIGKTEPACPAGVAKERNEG